MDEEDRVLTQIEYDAAVEKLVEEGIYPPSGELLASLPETQNVGDLLRTDKPAWLLPGFIRKSSITMITGASYTGKTVLALNMALCLAYQRPFMGHDTVTKHWPWRPVSLYCGWDGPAWDYAGIVKKLACGIGIDIREQDNNPAIPSPAEHLLWFGADNTVELPKLDRALHDIVHRGWRETAYTRNDSMLVSMATYPDVVFIDTFLDAHEQDENDNTAMKQTMALLKHIAHVKGVAVVLLHHPPKGGEAGTVYGAARGATCIMGSCDSILELKKAKGGGEGIQQYKCRWLKGRGGDLPDSFGAQRREWQKDGQDAMLIEPCADAVDHPAKTKANLWKARALNMICKEGGATVGEIMRATGVGKSVVYRWLAKVAKHDGGGNWTTS